MKIIFTRAKCLFQGINLYKCLNVRNKGKVVAEPRKSFEIMGLLLTTFFINSEKMSENWCLCLDFPTA